MRWLRKWIDDAGEARRPDVPDAGLDLDARLAITRQHGDFTLAHLTAVQPGLEHFGGPDGYIAHAFKMGRHYALGDPVASDGKADDLLDGFIDAARNPCFAQVTRKTADRLAKRGYKIGLLGCDFVFDLPAHDFSGRPASSIRASHGWLLKRDYSFEEVGQGEVAEELEALSKAWRATKIVSRREMAFLNTAFSAEPMPGTRRFVLKNPEGALDLVIDMHPMHRGGRVTGWTTMIKRKRPGATNHAEIGLTRHIVDQMAKEGAERVTLGLAPLAITGPSGYAESALLRTFLARIATHDLVNAKVFNLKGHAAFKRRFHAREEPCYFAWKDRSAIMAFTGLMRLSKMV